jgi:hypothetical protein
MGIALHLTLPTLIKAENKYLLLQVVLAHPPLSLFHFWLIS